MDYREAGVDVAAGRAFVQNIADLVNSTRRPEVLGGLGGFNGLFQLPTGYREPVLVSGTDGVGTKLKLAHQCDRHDTVGIDLVAMCVNDVLTCGAEPLFFLDYLATSQLNSEQLVQVVAGVTEGCQQAGCALLGGETAEMPGFYAPGEYDLAGFCVGIVEKQKILEPSCVQVGDIAIGLASTGIHSNGFSLVRKILDVSGSALSDRPPMLQGRSLAAELLTPTQIYVKPVQTLQQSNVVLHGMAHITGGGLPENLPRCLQPTQSVRVQLGTWTIPPVFDWIAETGNVSQADMFETFNMGIGFVMIVSPDDAETTIANLQQQGTMAWKIGEVVPGNQTVELVEP